jgi:hypothetical protein
MTDNSQTMPSAHATPARRRTRARTQAAAAPASLAGYWASSQSPLTSLLFVLPLLILHEIGVRHFASIPGTMLEHRVTAFTLLTRLFHYFGASGRYLPALAVVAVLLTWHIARQDRWRFHIGHVLTMYIEGLVLALPLVGVYLLFSPVRVSYVTVGEWKMMCSLYLGAGVYEELVWRLGAFAVLSFLLVDLVRMPLKVATPVIILTSAVAFSTYHMLGSQVFPWQAFVFIGLRGVYYGIIFLERGFGISVGVHTAYDLLFLTLREVSLN